MRGAVRWLACITLIACAAAPAQTFDATKIGTPANLSTATWHFALGDDPRWADPAFDDSQWKTFTPQRTFRSQGYTVPSRIWWSRIHVRIVPGTRNLAVRILDGRLPDLHQRQTGRRAGRVSRSSPVDLLQRTGLFDPGGGRPRRLAGDCSPGVVTARTQSIRLRAHG